MSKVFTMKESLLKPKLLIINKNQFGYLTDVYYWCKYLKDEYDVVLICMDVNKERVEIEDVNVRYINFLNFKQFRGIYFLLYSIYYLFTFRGKVIVVYFEHCHVLKKIFSRKRMLLDIRTLSVSSNKNIRECYDRQLAKACHIYDMVSVISQGVKDKLSLKDEGKVEILPLGSDVISCEQKDYSFLRLLYVGTFSGRNLEKTIKGVALFHDKYPQIEFTYDMIGDGNADELNYCRSLVTSLGIGHIVVLHGRIPLNKLKPYFDKSNIGISFVPMTDFYEYQPPTKTFEYILSGLYTIATSTSSNKELVSEFNGVLISDTPESFSSALEHVYLTRNRIDEMAIRQSLKDFYWKNIVDKKLRCIIEKL